MPTTGCSELSLVGGVASAHRPNLTIRACWPLSHGDSIIDALRLPRSVALNAPRLGLDYRLILTKHQQRQSVLLQLRRQLLLSDAHVELQLATRSRALNLQRQNPRPNHGPEQTLVH